MGTATEEELRDFDQLLNAVLDNPDQVSQLVEERPQILESVNNSAETVLQWLALENHVSGIRLLHELGATIPDFALVHALEAGHVEALELMLTLGGSFGIIDPYFALRNPVFELSMDKVKVLTGCLERHGVFDE